MNGNGFLDGQEIVNFEENESFGEVDEKTAWIDSKMDGACTRTMIAWAG